MTVEQNKLIQFYIVRKATQKWLVLEQPFLRISVCCVYTSPLRLRWMAVVSVVLSSLYCCANAYYFQKFFSRKIQLFRNQSLWVKSKKSSWAAVEIMFTAEVSVQGLVCSTRRSTNLVITKILASLFRENWLLIHWDRLRAGEMSSLFTGFPLRHNTQ